MKRKKKEKLNTDNGRGTLCTMKERENKNNSKFYNSKPKIYFYGKKADPLSRQALHSMIEKTQKLCIEA